MPNVLSPRDLVSRPINIDETVLSSSSAAETDQFFSWVHWSSFCFFCHAVSLDNYLF